jgi:hypothetical protein
MTLQTEDERELRAELAAKLLIFLAPSLVTLGQRRGRMRLRRYGLV